MDHGHTGNLHPPLLHLLKSVRSTLKQKSPLGSKLKKLKIDETNMANKAPQVKKRFGNAKQTIGDMDSGQY